MLNSHFLLYKCNDAISFATEHILNLFRKVAWAYISEGKKGKSVQMWLRQGVWRDCESRWPLTEIEINKVQWSSWYTQNESSSSLQLWGYVARVGGGRASNVLFSFRRKVFILASRRRALHIIMHLNARRSHESAVK